MAAKKVTKKNPEKTVDAPPYGDRNADPVTDTPGSHPIETGVGAAIGGVASGAAVGAVGGPIGAVVGAVVGGVIGGGLAGKGIGELIDPTTEDNWIREYLDEDEKRTSQPTGKTVVASGDACQVDAKPSKSRSKKAAVADQDVYRAPYHYGLDAGKRHTGRSFAEVESDLERDWHNHRGDSSLEWQDARPAAEKAFARSVELHAERLKVGKDKKKVGEVDVHTEVHTEHETVTVPVEREEVVIERRHVDGDKNADDFKIGRYATEEIRIPVSKEEVHVEKETVVTDEVKVGKRKVVDTKKIEADVKHEELRVDTEGETRVKDKKKR